MAQSPYSLARTRRWFAAKISSICKAQYIWHGGGRLQRVMTRPIKSPCHTNVFYILSVHRRHWSHPSRTKGHRIYTPSRPPNSTACPPIIISAVLETRNSMRCWATGTPVLWRSPTGPSHKSLWSAGRVGAFEGAHCQQKCLGESTTAAKGLCFE